MNRLSARAALICALLFPYLFLVWHINEWSMAAPREVASVFGFTILQAALSATFALAFGFWGARGLLYWTRFRAHFEGLVILPGAVPTLFVVLSLLRVIDPFPFGLWGIVLAHTALNTGLVAVSVVRLFESRVAGWADLALVEGARPFDFLAVVIRFLLRDLAMIWLFVFSICFSSFAIPLMLGGFQGTTVEVLIFEKVRISGAWSEALGLSVLQTALMILLASILGRQEAPVSSRPAEMRLLVSKWGILPPLVFAVAVVTGLLGGLGDGVAELNRIPEFSSILPAAFGTTLAVGAGAGLLIAALLFLSAFAMPEGRFQKFLRGFVAPSSVLTGFVFLVTLGRATPVLGMAIAISLVSFPMLYRLQLDGLIQALRLQVETARTLGASWGTVFRYIVFPQIAPTVGYLAGLASFWASGEFAISGILSGGTKPLAVVVRDLAGFYKLDGASVLVWPIMGAGLVLWFIFWRLGSVVGRKSYL